MKVKLLKIEGKTSKTSERELNSLFPEGVKSGEKTIHKRDGSLGISIELTQEEAQELGRARELLSHTIPDASFGQVIARLAKDFNERKDPLRKDRVATPQRSTKASKRRQVIQKSRGACSFTDPSTGRICGSRYQLEIDHIVPRAKGGSDDPHNLRCLCRRHNQLMAEIEFGREFMDLRRSTPS